MAKTVKGRTTAELPPTAVLKGSRFIATTAAVRSEAEAKGVLTDVAQELSDAHHHCAAWRIATPTIDRALDAGEPSGSAGRPILTQLVGRDLVDTIVVVTRYFGGVKLGIGGLVRAYGGAAAEVLDQAEVVARVPTRPVRLQHRYDDGPAIERVIARLGLDPGEAQYGATVIRRLEVPLDVEVEAELARALADATGGRVVLPSARDGD